MGHRLLSSIFSAEQTICRVCGLERRQRGRA